MDDDYLIREELNLPDNELGKEMEKRFNNGKEFMVSCCGLRVKIKCSY